MTFLPKKLQKFFLTLSLMGEQYQKIIFSSLPLLQNSLITHQFSAMIGLPSITQKVKLLMDDNSLNLLSLDHFQNRYDIRVRPLMFFGIVSAVKSLQRQILGTHQQYEFKVLSTHFSKAKNHLESFTNNKWHKDFCSSTDKNVNSRNVFQAANICTTICRLINFNFRFLHRRLPTNSYLQKQDGKCTFCRDEKEDLTHLFWKCQKTQNFWDNFSLWLQSCQIL